MSAPRVPRGALVGAAVLLGASLVLAGSARRLGSAEPPAQAVVSADLRFEDEPGGTIVITNARDERVIGVVQPETNGFLRGVLRGMFRARKLEGEARRAPFRLERTARGELSLLDPTLGRRVALDPFGATNAAVFANLLDAASDQHP